MESAGLGLGIRALALGISLGRVRGSWGGLGGRERWGCGWGLVMKI